MDAYTTRMVRDWAQREGVDDAMLFSAAQELDAGQAEANHGSGLFKKRIAVNVGRGKSGGARTLVAANRRGRVVFLYGFKKNDQDSVKKDVLKAYKAQAKVYNNLSDEDVKNAVKKENLFRVKFK